MKEHSLESVCLGPGGFAQVNRQTATHSVSAPGSVHVLVEKLSAVTALAACSPLAPQTNSLALILTRPFLFFFCSHIAL